MQWGYDPYVRARSARWSSAAEEAARVRPARKDQRAKQGRPGPQGNTGPGGEAGPAETPGPCWQQLGDAGIQEVGSISLTVTGLASGAPLAGATVTVSPGTATGHDGEQRNTCSSPRYRSVATRVTDHAHGLQHDDRPGRRQHRRPIERRRSARHG